MTINKLIGVFVLIFSILAFNACKIDEDLNIDPNEPIDASLNLILPSAQLSTAFLYGNDNARATSIWMQQHAGTDRQYVLIGRYTFTESDTDTPWQDVYTNGLMDLNRMLTKAEANNSPHYLGVAQIMMAMTIGNITDLWGDIPYTEAFKGIEGDLSPNYDSQADIYATIFELLDNGKTNINAAESTFSPGSDDLIYQGNLDKWEACANVLIARYNLHKSKLEGQTAYENALTALDDLVFADNNEDAMFQFSTNPGNRNFFYEFNIAQRLGYMSAGEYFVDLLKDTNDPRLENYFTGNDDGEYIGQVAGVADFVNISTTGPSFGLQDSPVPLVTYSEQKFIEAEAAFQTGDLTRAATAYNDAIKASLDKHAYIDQTDSTSIANGETRLNGYINSNAAETESSITLEKIMMQKYTALFTQVEVYNDWRRTGFPQLELPQDAALTETPRRFVYPISERLYNKNTPTANASLTDRVWWDVE